MKLKVRQCGICASVDVGGEKRKKKKKDLSSTKKYNKICFIVASEFFVYCFCIVFNFYYSCRRGAQKGDS